MTRLLSMYEHQDRPELEYPGGALEETECDVAVVGGGGSGLVAAVRAAQRGASVIVIEKMDKPGGNSWFAGGLLTTYSKFQKELGMPDMTNEYFKKAYRQNKYTLNPAIFRRYISNTGTFYEWMADLGLDTDNIKYVMDAVAMVKVRKDPGYLNNPQYGPGLMGSTILSVVIDAMAKLPIKVLMSTKAEKLITDENGAVTGLVARGQDREYSIHAKNVILAAGGFGCNTELLRRFLPKYFSRDNFCSHYCLLSTTGDGITMAEDIGAEVGKNISVGIGALAHNPGSFSIQKLFRSAKGVIVNKNGRRFVAEDDTDDAEFAVDMQPDGLAYYIFDEAMKPVLYDEAAAAARYGDAMPPKEQLEADLIREHGEGKIRIAESLADAAEFIGADETTLAETISRYNAMCDNHLDDELFKNPDDMLKLTTFPMYVIRCQRNFDVTMGGVSIDEHLRALKPDGEPLKGLYVTGDLASNWMGEDYGPLFSSFAWAMNSGYLAGEETTANLR